MKQLIFVIPLLFAPILVGCDQAADNYATEASLSPETEEYAEVAGKELQLPIPQTDAAPPASEAPDATPSATENKKIIYNGEIYMQVDSLEIAIRRVSELVDQAGGYVSNQRVSDSRYEKEAQMTLRLPVAGFSNSMKAITELATFVNHQGMDSRDVTAQWIDLESRLATKREVRDRYIDILRNRARKVEDILEAEEKIRVITEEIEAKEGQLRYLRDQVSLSTLELRMYQTIEYREAPDAYRRGFGSQLVDALGDGVTVVKGIVLGLVTVWPLWFIIPLLIWGWRRWRKR